MTDLHTERLILHPIDVAVAKRVLARQPGPEDSWAPEFPFDGDVIGISAFLRSTAEVGDPGVFGHYRVTRRADGAAIGGIGLKGSPQHGSVEIGYGLVHSARGHGYAAEAVRAFLDLTADHGVRRVLADTDEDNIASQRILEHAGFINTGTSENLRHYHVLLDARAAGGDRVAHTYGQLGQAGREPMGRTIDPSRTNC